MLQGKKPLWRRMSYTVVMAALAAAFLFPVLITVSNSFMSKGEILQNYGLIHVSEQQEIAKGEFVNLKFIPDMVVLHQYLEVLLWQNRFLLMFWNSVKLVLSILLGQMAVAAMAAYAFSHMDFRGRDYLFFVYIVAMLMPYQVTLVPNYIMSDKLGMIGKYESIIFPGVFSPFGVFLLRQFMINIPKSYSEEARIDGAGHFDIFFKIVLPIVKPGLASLFILLFIDQWNMVEQPLIFLHQQDMYPLSVYLSDINKEEIDLAFAASTVYMIPPLLIFLYGKEYLIEGIQVTGIK